MDYPRELLHIVASLPRMWSLFLRNATFYDLEKARGQQTLMLSFNQRPEEVQWTFVVMYS